MESLKGFVGSHQAGKGVLERHEHHHDTEDLQRIAGHVHHDAGHGERFNGRESDFPCLFQLEGFHFFVGGWFSRLAFAVLAGFLITEC